MYYQTGCHQKSTLANGLGGVMATAVESATLQCPGAPAYGTVHDASRCAVSVAGLRRSAAEGH